MRAGWILIGLGIFGAVWFQHADAVVVGVGMVLTGAWMLTLKEMPR